MPKVFVNHITTKSGEVSLFTRSRKELTIEEGLVMTARIVMVSTLLKVFAEAVITGSVDSKPDYTL